MSENEEFEARCNSLAERLRAMLHEKLGDGWENRKKSGTSDKRTISHLFGIAYAHELDEMDEEFACHVIAARAGLPGRTYGPRILAGWDLAQYVDVKPEFRTVHPNPVWRGIRT